MGTNDTAPSSGLIRRLSSPSTWAIAVLCVITLAFYYNLWWPGQILMKRDAYTFHLPIKQHTIERLSQGDLPQWFPYEALGRSFIGATATGIFHPFTALYFLLPVPDAYRVSTLLSVLLAAIGAFALARALKLTLPAALVSGIGFALSGYIVSLTENILYLYSICILPIFCLALRKALTGSLAWSVAPAILWATVFLIGDMQTGYYYGFIAVAWTAAHATRSYRQAALRLAFVTILAALLAGVQLAPTGAIFSGSDRAHSTQFQAVEWSTHPLRLLTIFASPIGRDSNPADIAKYFLGAPHQGLWAESVYLGVPLIGLALLGGWHHRESRVLVWLGITALVLALGRFSGLYEAFYHVVPLWSAFRYPEKLMGVVSFCVALLAGAGFDALRQGKGRSILWLMMAFVCTATAFGLESKTAEIQAIAHFHAPAPVAHDVLSTAATAFLFSTATAALMWLLIGSAARGVLREDLQILALIALITIDLSRANLEAYHTGPNRLYLFTPPFVDTLIKQEGPLQPGHFRLVSFPKELLRYPENFKGWLDEYAAGSVERRQSLELEHNAPFHIETTYSYLPGKKAELATSANIRSGAYLGARFNVAYYIGHRSEFNAPLFDQSFLDRLVDYDLELYRNPIPVKPRAYLSRRPERATSPVGPAALFRRTDFLNGEVDVIETSEPQLPGPALDGSAAIEEYAPEKVRVRVATPQPAVLILLDSFDPGWTATLENGLNLPIRRANVLTRAVVVPAGRYVVTFAYETPWLEEGAAASMLGGLLCMVLILLPQRVRGHTPA